MSYLLYQLVVAGGPEPVQRRFIEKGLVAIRDEGGDRLIARGALIDLASLGDVP